MRLSTLLAAALAAATIGIGSAQALPRLAMPSATFAVATVDGAKAETVHYIRRKHRHLRRDHRDRRSYGRRHNRGQFFGRPGGIGETRGFDRARIYTEGVARGPSGERRVRPEYR